MPPRKKFVRLDSWLDGGLLSEESKRYVGNFLSVHRMRPHDEESDCGNSDDIIEDEELQLSSATLEEALGTRVGGKAQSASVDEQEKAEGGASHFQNSSAAMDLGQEV